MTCTLHTYTLQHLWVLTNLKGPAELYKVMILIYRYVGELDNGLLLTINTPTFCLSEAVLVL